MSAKTFREWRAEMDRRAGNQISLLEASLLNEGWDAGQESLRAALLADAPDVERIVKALRALHAGKKSAPSVGGQQLGLEEYRIVTSGAHLESLIEAADTLLAQQARIRELEGEVSKLKGHAEAMATTLDHWTSIDACKCAALDAYRRDHPEEPK